MAELQWGNLQSPNIAGNFQNGYAFGTQVKQQRQAEQDQNMLRGLAPQIIAGDAGAYDQAAAISPEAANAYQGAGDSQLRRLKGFINYVDQARATGNTAAVDAALQAGSGFVGRFIGKPGPTEWTPDMEPGWEQLKAKVAMMETQQGPEGKAIGNALVDPVTGRVIYQGPEAPVNAQYVDVPDGNGGTVKMIFDPRTRKLSKPQYGDSPPPVTGDTSVPGEDGSPIPMQTVTGADGQTYRVQVGDPNAAQIGAADMGTGGQAASVQLPTRDVAPPPAAGLGYTPPKAQGEQFQTLTPQEVAGLGLPSGTIAQRSPTGQVQIINKPRDLPTGGQVIDNGDGTTTYIPAGKITEGERNASGFYQRMLAANEEMKRLESAGYDPTNRRDYYTAGGEVLNPLATPEGQQYQQAKANWVRANLRKESGAAIGVAEMDQEIKNYFPIPGDSPEVIAQKARNRTVTERAMRQAAGGGLAPQAAPQQQAQGGRAATGGGAVQRARNPQTGEILELRNGQWVPAQ